MANNRPPPKPGVANNPKLSAADPATIRAVTDATRAEAVARQAAAKATNEQTRAIQAQTRVMQQSGKATQQVADATESFADHADEATAAGEDMASATKRGTSAFERLEKASKMAGTAIEGVEAAYKLYIATHYDAIHAANMSMRMMQREIPKSAQAAGDQINKLTVHFKELREQSTKVATDFVVPWQVAIDDMDSLLEAFGTNMNEAGDGVEKELVALQRRMYATRELTGQSFADQLKNIDDGITHLGLSAEAYQDQIEIMAKAPALIAGSFDKSVKIAARYKDILKTNGVIRAVQDMIKALDMENVSVKRLAASYGVMIEQSIKYGRSQKEAIAYAEKMTEALAGVGDKSDLFQLPNFLAGQKMMADLSKGGLGTGGKADQEAREGFFEDLGTTMDKATDDQKAQVEAKLKQLVDVAAGGEVNAGTIGQFAPTKMRQHAKLQSLNDYQGLTTGAVGVPGVQLALQQVLGAKNISGADAEQFKLDVAKKGGGTKALEDTLDEFQANLEKQGKLGEGELSGADKVAKERLAAENQNVVIMNALGPNSLIVDALKDAVKSLSSIEGATGFLAAAAGYAGAATGQAVATGAEKEQTATLSTDVDATKAVGAKSGKVLTSQDYANAILQGDVGNKDVAAAQALSKQMHDRAAQQQNKTAIDRFQDSIKKSNDESAGEALTPFQVLQAIDTAATGGGVQQASARGVETDAQLLDYAIANRGKFADKQQQGTVPGHRAGLGYVPYDDYLAQLHEGESVLSKQKSRMLRDAVLRAPQPAPQRNGGGAPKGGGDDSQALVNGNMPMEAQVVGDKLVFTITDAGSAIAQLLLQAQNANRG